MAYIVQAVLTERGTGTYRGQLSTRQAAIESAKELRDAGMKTVVIGPDGTPIDETEIGYERPVPASTPSGASRFDIATIMAPPRSFLDKVCRRYLGP
jgi:hypothetical protein